VKNRVGVRGRGRVGVSACGRKTIKSLRRNAETPKRRHLPFFREAGQAATEIVLLLPLFVTLIGAGMFLLYSAWQGIKTQQAANFAARIQGQERVAGGTGLPQIDQANGAQVGEGDSMSGDTSNGGKVQASVNPPNDRASVYGKFYYLVKNNFFAKSVQNEVIIPQPIIGQNIDKVSVTRLINVPNIPFLKSGTLPSQVQVQGTAWGGEDTYMYGLPRWGPTTGSDTPEWKDLIKPGQGD
jgi:hypothetical protein